MKTYFTKAVNSIS